MKNTGLVVGLSVLLAACGASNEEPLDAPEEAPVVGGEEADANASAEDEKDDAAGDDEATTESATKTADEPDQAELASADPNTIPARFHGTWDVSDSDCVNFSDGLTNVAASEVSFYEGALEVSSVTTEGRGVILEGKYTEGGMDEAKDMTMTLSLVPSAGGAKLDRSFPPDTSEIPRLKKCN